MCLSKITKFPLKKNNIYYAVGHLTRTRRFKTPYFGSSWKVGETKRVKSKQFLWDYVGGFHRYLSGFHRYKYLKDTKKETRVCCGIFNQRRIIGIFKIRKRDIHITGIQGSYPVVVAKEATLLKVIS